MAGFRISVLWASQGSGVNPCAPLETKWDYTKYLLVSLHSEPPDGNSLLVQWLLLLFLTVSSSAAHRDSSFSSSPRFSSASWTFAIACSSFSCCSVSSFSSRIFWSFTLAVHSSSFFPSRSEFCLRRWRICQEKQHLTSTNSMKTDTTTKRCYRSRSSLNWEAL